MAASEVKVARSGLVGLDPDVSKAGHYSTAGAGGRPRSRVIEKSERVGASGTPILTLSDSKKLEIVADVRGIRIDYTRLTDFSGVANLRLLQTVWVHDCLRVQELFQRASC